MAEARSKSGSSGEEDSLNGEGRMEDRPKQEREEPRKNGDRKNQDRSRDVDRSRKNGYQTWALLNSDQPGMSLVVSPLIGTNYLGWSIAIKTALEAKGKLGFLTTEESLDEEEYWKWKKADSMVKSWVINSMTKELADLFVFCRTTKELWDELQERFGASCGPQLYQIQKEAALTVQGSDSVVTYYGKLRKWWEQLSRLSPLPRCTCGNCSCGINKRLIDRDSSDKLIQFLMGLNQKFKPIRTQVLNLDPFPTVNRAFAMVTQDEMQMEVGDTTPTDPLEMAAAMVKKDDDMKRARQKDDKKWDKICSHCQMKGHLKESCFKIVGYPEWYKELKEQRKRNGGNKLVATTTDNPLDDEPEKSKDWATMISQIVRQEIQKAKEERVNVAYLGDFTGNISTKLNTRNEWIIDTGASNHICHNKSLMQNVRKLDKPINIHLPNGTNILVKETGTVNIGSLQLKDVFYIPSFHYNLVSVNQLTKTNSANVFFDHNSYLIQDLKTKKSLATGRVKGNLYWLKDNNNQDLCTSDPILNSCIRSPYCWHSRLGHAPLNVINRIDGIKDTVSQFSKACDICHNAKQHRLPFPNSINDTGISSVPLSPDVARTDAAEQPLEIHIDPIVDDQDDHSVTVHDNTDIQESEEITYQYHQFTTFDVGCKGANNEQSTSIYASFMAETG
ncbi:uncharacterized protein G2W53_010089 [Senna tora]|uniref:Uncharacterized protein n=1 Tax=Senna tora TaxID=362788 RepID=A0A835CAY6_9FABA|nr:uncharacterized protein G2W53_010089 [Senna tora]